MWYLMCKGEWIDAEGRLHVFISSYEDNPFEIQQEAVNTADRLNRQERERGGFRYFVAHRSELPLFDL